MVSPPILQIPSTTRRNQKIIIRAPTHAPKRIIVRAHDELELVGVTVPEAEFTLEVTG